MKEVGLDPEDWEAFRGLAHRMVDDMVDHLQALGDTPAWQPYPEAARERIADALPTTGVGEAAVYEEFLQDILPYTNGNRHPRFAGWAQGPGSALSMMADMLASGMNAHCGGFDQASQVVERTVCDWLKQIMGMPGDASAVLLSGGTVANLVGLACARDAAADSVLAGGLAEHPRLVFYASEQVHGWGSKCAQLLGLGRNSLRVVPVNGGLQMDVAALESMIQRDLRQGFKPFCVIGTIGTINSGACDPLEDIADLCRNHGLWYHIDGAFGAWAVLSRTHKSLAAGMGRCDSLAFDLHKWGYLPFEAACAIVRDPSAHERSFSLSGSYLTSEDRGVIRGGLPFASLAPELTRNFKALKVWMQFKAYGTDRLARCIDQNLAQAKALAFALEERGGFEIMAPVSLSIVCFRAVAEGRQGADLDALNREILLRMQESGFAVPSHTTLRGCYTIRAAFFNHRTRMSDVDAMATKFEELRRECLAISSSLEDTDR